MYPLDDTIAAIASASGGAARGIVRISGPNVLYCLEAVFRPGDERIIQAPSHAQTIAGSWQLTGLNAPMPGDLYLWPEGRSYTGQMVAELHTLGSPPLLDALLNSFCTAGARMAEPGEFTLRAFLSGRIDLTQAEAVLGVIDATDPHELQVAMTQLAGGLANPLHRLRETLLELLAHLEAGFDFAEEDLPFITCAQLYDQLVEAVGQVARLTAQMQSRSTIETAIRAVLVGQPNTGKSSLFNALARKSQALVSDLPGTTRDYLVAELDFEGRKCQLIDTAGFHAEPIEQGAVFAFPEQAAQLATAEQIRLAHVRLLCLDATRALDAWEQNELERGDVPRQIVVWTKSDAAIPDYKGTVPSAKADRDSPQVVTSSVTGEGLDRLREELCRMVYAADSATGDVVSSTAVRCCQSLNRAWDSLRNARDIAQDQNKGTVPYTKADWGSPHGEEFIAAEIRAALDELGRIVGAVYADDVLERIFSRFCVGK